MTRLINKNTTIPAKETKVFSTAADNQPAVTVHVLQGEREVSSGNKSLGQFNLEGIPPAPRGTPQIEVAFDIDSNGILHVSARDKKTGRESKITIKASSGLNEEEIERMVKDAEVHAEEDRQAASLAWARNECDALTHTVRRQVEEAGGKLAEEDREKIEAAVKEAEAAAKSGDESEIQEKVRALAEVAAKLAEADAAAPDESAAAGAEAGEKPKANGKSAEENVVDAEFRDVDEGGGKRKRG